MGDVEPEIGKFKLLADVFRVWEPGQSYVSGLASNNPVSVMGTVILVVTLKKRNQDK